MSLYRVKFWWRSVE